MAKVDKTFAFLAVFLGIIGFLIALLAKKDDKYVMYYAKQSLVLFIAYVIAGFIFAIPIIGRFILGPILMLVLFVLWIIGIVNAFSGEMKPLPIIGKYGENFNF